MQWKLMYSGYGTEQCVKDYYKIIDKCREKNIRNKIGGYVVLDLRTKAVHQYLEGPKKAVLDTYERIQKDPRVENITFFMSRKCTRKFTNRDGLTPWRYSAKANIARPGDVKSKPFYQLSPEVFHEVYEEIPQLLDHATNKMIVPRIVDQAIMRRVTMAEEARAAMLQAELDRLREEVKDMKRDVNRTREELQMCDPKYEKTRAKYKKIRKKNPLQMSLSMNSSISSGDVQHRELGEEKEPLICAQSKQPLEENKEPLISDQAQLREVDKMPWAEMKTKPQQKKKSSSGCLPALTTLLGGLFKKKKKRRSQPELLRRKVGAATKEAAPSATQIAA